MIDAGADAGKDNGSKEFLQGVCGDAETLNVRKVAGDIPAGS